MNSTTHFRTLLSASLLSAALLATGAIAQAQAQSGEGAPPRAKATVKQNPANSEAAAMANARREPIKMPVTQAACKAAMAPGKPYFVEFRSRTAASYGHTFVFYGKLGAGNRFASFKVAGLHPAGEDPATYMQGHFAPVPAETGVSFGDLDEQYLTARFCVTLNEADFKRVSAYIRQLQVEQKTWHAMTYNCNSFGADIARYIGLDTPNPNMYLPDKFITRLAEDNRNRVARSSDKSSDAGTLFTNWMQQNATRR